MHVSGEEGLDAVEPPAATQLAPSDSFLSPSIQRLAGEKMAAYEMKFLIGDARAVRPPGRSRHGPLSTCSATPTRM